MVPFTAETQLFPEGFSRVDSVEGRWYRLFGLGVISYDQMVAIKAGLSPDIANILAENVIGVFGLPLGLISLNVNGKDYIAPAVTEEASVIAAANSGAKIVRYNDGFTAEANEPIMMGQLQLLPRGGGELVDLDEKLEGCRAELTMLGNSYIESMVNRGGGIAGFRVRHFSDIPVGSMASLDIFVNVCDAAGANKVNIVCESLKSKIGEKLDCYVNMAIVSNLATSRLAKAACRIHIDDLGMHNNKWVADLIVAGWAFAVADPYRATTHNKGILNGIDAVVSATGNDWRSVEAGAWGYAAREGQLKPLTYWEIDGNYLAGELEMPIAVGTHSKVESLNPAVRANLDILRVQDAKELAGVIASVGLAQNLAAIRALVTVGINSGHLSLHNRV